MKHLLVVLSLLTISGCVKLNYVNMPDPNQEPTIKEALIIPQQQEVYGDYITPQAYGIIANRTTNKMLDETKKLHEKTPQPKIYIREIVKEGEDLPDGFYYANSNLKEIIANSNTFVVVNNQNDADYHLQTVVSEYTNPNTNSPIILYSTRLLDKDGNAINEWAESISQLANDDKSYW